MATFEIALNLNYFSVSVTVILGIGFKNGFGFFDRVLMSFNGLLICHIAFGIVVTLVFFGFGCDGFCLDNGFKKQEVD